MAFNIPIPSHSHSVTFAFWFSYIFIITPKQQTVDKIIQYNTTQNSNYTNSNLIISSQHKTFGNKFP